MDSEQKILEASIQVFTEKGYLGASTKEIANVAGVSEMTLFRRFSTKMNLFETMIQQTLDDELKGLNDLDFSSSLDTFLGEVLHNRLMAISEHTSLIRMMIQESLQGRLSQELDYIQQISSRLTNMFQKYFTLHQLPMNIELVHLIIGVLLEYAIVQPQSLYSQKSETEQQEFVQQYLSLLQLKK